MEEEIGAGETASYEEIQSSQGDTCVVGMGAAGGCTH